MRTILRACILLVVVLLASAARADEAAAWKALRQDGVVALLRHADAPGIGDPAGWRLDDCATQRNLSEGGRAEARAVGARLRQERIRIAKVLSSPWCRCLETARLADVGAVQTEATFGNAYVMSDKRVDLREGGRAVIDRWRGPGVLLVVTHGENIRALTGQSPSTGEIVVVAPGAGSALKVIGAVPPPAALNAAHGSPRSNGGVVTTASKAGDGARRRRRPRGSRPTAPGPAEREPARHAQVRRTWPLPASRTTPCPWPRSASRHHGVARELRARHARPDLRRQRVAMAGVDLALLGRLPLADRSGGRSRARRCSPGPNTAA